MFSGKQAKLNRIILLLHRSSKTSLTKYDIYKQIRNIKGYKHYDSKTVYRRLNALIGEGLIAKVGSRPGLVEELKEIIRAWGQNPEEILTKDALLRGNISETQEIYQSHQLSLLADQPKQLINSEVSV